MLNEKMNWKLYRPIWPFAVGLPLAIAALSWVLVSAGHPTLLPLLLAVVFLFLFFAARRVPSVPIRSAFLTVVPALIFQVLGLIALGFTAFAEATSSPDRTGALPGVGLMIVGTMVIGGSIISMSLVSLLAGWIVKLTARSKQRSSNRDREPR